MYLISFYIYPSGMLSKDFLSPCSCSDVSFYLPPNIEILKSSTSYAWDHHPPRTTCPTQQLSTTSLCKLKVNKDEMGVPKICGAEMEPRFAENGVSLQFRTVPFRW